MKWTLKKPKTDLNKPFVWNFKWHPKERPRPPVPNVTFWTYKKTSCFSCFQPPKASPTARAFATPKQQGPEGRTGPAGHGLQCLTSLSEPTRKLAVWPKTAPAPQPNSRAEGRTGPAGHGPQCLTSFSAPTRKLAVWAVFQPPKASQTAPPSQPNSRALRDGPGLRATAPSA